MKSRLSSAIVRAALAAAYVLLLVPALALAVTPPAGPPFPDPVNDQVVYDFADILSPQTEAAATQIITGIEQRTGAELAVYTQYKPGATTDSTERDALALINQWGIGRKGFDDGLAIMWNVTRQPCQPYVSGNGQVQLYAAPGYAATYLTNEERQSIFDNDMLPHLKACDEDAALLAALEKIDAATTPEHAQFLNLVRIANAVVGLILAPVVFVLLVVWAGWSWLRFGRDPVYLDSASILMPAPPPDLTAASGAVVWEGRATRRALTTAMLDLASRGELSFVPDKGLLTTKTGIQLTSPPTDDPYVVRNRRRPLSDAEEYALDRMRGIAEPSDNYYISPDDLLKFGKYTDKFNERIERHVAAKGWFREPPAKATRRWMGRGTIALVLGVIGVIVGFNVPASGLVMLGGALVAAGVVIYFIARSMPQRTMPGAMIYAQLAAYRRTLQMTMAQARSMNQVIQAPGLEWMETPDQAVVWGVALGLQSEVEQVIERSAEDAQAGMSTYNPWVPRWYGYSSWSSSSGGPSGFAPGVFSSSGIPDFGGMMSALGSIGNSPSSSGGSGGFGGGGGGGGGGGAGGGY